MRAVDLYGVKARFFRAPGGLSECLHEVLYLWDGQRPGYRSNPRIWDWGRGDDLSARILWPGPYAAMVDLERDRGSMLVSSLGKPLKARDEAIIIDAELRRYAAPPGIDGRILDDEQAYAALSAAADISDELLGHFMLCRTKSGVHGRHDDAVADCHAFDGDRLKNILHGVTLH